MESGLQVMKPKNKIPFDEVLVSFLTRRYREAINATSSKLVEGFADQTKQKNNLTLFAVL
jgi:hypothetical protein